MSIETCTYTRFRKISLFLLIALLITSCDLFYNEGEWKSELRDTQDYKNVVIDNIAEIYYHYADTFAIEVFHYENELSSISTNVSGQTLTIKNSFNGQAYTSIRNPEVHLYAPTIFNIEIKEESGIGLFCKDTIINTSFQLTIKADLIDAELLISTDTLQVFISKATGLISMKGKAEKCNLQNNGESPIKGKQLAINQLNISHQSSQDVELTVNNNLSYQILRNGNIIIWGNPTNSGEVFGTGKLIFK
jgi:hypothetical protein